MREFIDEIVLCFGLGVAVLGFSGRSGRFWMVEIWVILGIGVLLWDFGEGWEVWGSWRDVGDLGALRGFGCLRWVAILWVVILGGSLWGLEVLGLLGSFGVLVWGGSFRVF